MNLEDLQPEATVRGILPDALVTVVSVGWHGTDALTLVYRGPNGRVADEVLYRHDEPRLEIAEIARELAYRLYTHCERKKRAADALAYNGLVQSWPEILRLAQGGGEPALQQPDLLAHE